MATESEEEIKRAPNALIAEHGVDAPHYAARRLADVRRGGDAEIITYWRDMISAINKMLSKSE